MKILLDKIMHEKNLTNRQVTIMTGISKSTINRIKNGEVSPSADTLEILAKGLKVRIYDQMCIRDSCIAFDDHGRCCLCGR